MQLQQKTVVIHHRRELHEERVEGAGPTMVTIRSQAEWEEAVKGHPFAEKNQLVRVLDFTLGQLQCPVAEVQADGALVRRRWQRCVRETDFGT